MNFTKILDWFTPEKMSNDDKRDARSVMAVAFVVSMAGVVFVPTYSFLGHITGALIILFGSVSAALTPFLIKIFRNLSVARHIPAITFYLTMVGLAYTQDGLSTTSLAWFVAVPTIALFTGGIALSIFWGALSASSVIFFYLAPQFGLVLPENPLSADSMSFLLTSGTAGLIFFILGFGIANKKLKDSALHLMNRMANEDMLTGISNRRRFFELGTHLYIKGEATFAVMIDIDNFKRINDSYGHPTGDEVIKILAETISGHLRDGDIFGRLGGEEFGLIFPDDNREAVENRVEEMRQAVEDKVVTTDENEEIKFTISCGIAEYKPEYSSLDFMLKAADDALYEAKGSGRNRVIFRLPVDAT
jgi:diguanylate cyclase (GGDEF)-like protein